MESKAKLFGHAIHPMLIVFPLGLLSMSVIFDIIHFATGVDTWAQSSFWMMGAGIIGGLVAALFGLLDWLAIPDGTRAKVIGRLHGAGNLAVVVLFIVSWLVRRPDQQHPNALAFILSLIGVGLALVTAWLGGELVERLGVGVDEGANLDAPNSLSHQPARAAGVTPRMQP
jgi:uncharacterized membrane protein